MDPLILNNSIERIKPLISKEEAEVVDTKVNNLKKSHGFAVSEYCFDKFIKSEMNLQSSGLRGVGRVTDHPPRFGGYYRRNINYLYRDEIFELEKLFKELLYIGYFTHVLLYEEVLRPAELEDKYKLYQMWIMYILGFDNNSFSEGIGNLGKASGKSVDKLKEKLYKFGFPKTLLEEDVLDRILRFYGIAGFTLRRREMGIKL